MSDYKSVLSRQELERYQRFHFEKDRHSYLVSHALLRYSLSKYADVQACHWQFAVNEHGKPELDPSIDLGIRFNLTHTDDLCACVMTVDRSCGIDAEYIHRKNNLESVAQRLFADEELARLSKDNIQPRFYYFWTLREAYVKALGTGLAGSSKAFYFDVGEIDKAVSMRGIDSSGSESERWHFRLYEPNNDHVLAVGYESLDDLPVLMKEYIP